MLKLREGTKAKFEEYKHAVDAANEVISKHKASYATLVDSMLKLEQARIAYSKPLLTKFGHIMEKVLKRCAERAAAVSPAANGIKAEDDMKALQINKDMRGGNTLFSLVKCMEYDSEYDCGVIP